MQIEDALAPWLQTCKPCQEGQHTRALTTDEILAMLERFSPGEYDAHQVVTLLHKKGYTHALVGNDLRWLVRTEA